MNRFAAAREADKIIEEGRVTIMVVRIRYQSSTMTKYALTANYREKTEKSVYSFLQTSRHRVYHKLRCTK
jgi:hypothetical protein